MGYDHLTVSPKSQNIVDNTETDDEEAIATLDVHLLSSLVGVVLEVLPPSRNVSLFRELS
jgi:hypothetical protein